MESDDLEPRVAALAELRDFRWAMRQDFNTMRQDFASLREQFDRGFEQCDQGFTEMRGRFDATAAGLQQIADRLETIITDR